MTSRHKYGASVVFNTDCEGPTIANDVAHAAATALIPNGARLFAQLSAFDDYTAYATQREHYNAGDTLRVLLPFLKAYGRSEGDFRRWLGRQRIQWISGARDGIRYLREAGFLVFEISASYLPFAARVARGLSIPPSRVYATDFAMDQYPLGGIEAFRLRHLAEEITGLQDVPKLELRSTRTGVKAEISGRVDVYNRMDQIIWGEMAENLAYSSRMLRENRAMGGREKANAIFDSLAQASISADRAIYVGDSITDVDAFNALNDAGGITISFNGNEYAVEHATYCSWGESSLLPALLGGIFARGGKREFDSFIRSGGAPCKSFKADPYLRRLYKQLRNIEWGVAARTKDRRRMKCLLAKSLTFRRSTRKEAAVLS